MDEGNKRHHEQSALPEGNTGRLRAPYTETSSSVRRRNLLHPSEESVWLWQSLLHSYGKQFLNALTTVKLYNLIVKPPSSSENQTQPSEYW